MKKYIVLLAGIIAMTGLVHAQAPASIAGLTAGVKITGADGSVFSTNGFYVTVIANDGNSFQSFADNQTTEAGTLSSYAASGAILTADFMLTSPAPIPGSVKYVFTSALSGTNSVTAPDVGGYQNGNFTMFANPVPASIAGRDFHVSIQEGGGSFATNGEFVLSLASSGNGYTITAIRAGGANSHGTYSYSQLNNSCGRIQLADSDGTGSTVYVGFTNATSGGFYLASTNGYQIGNTTLLTAQPLSSIVGDTVLAAVTSGTGPFATNGYFLFVPADSGTNYQIIGLAHVNGSDGTYSYSVSGASATMSLDDNVDGPLVGLLGLNVFFSASFQGDYVLNAGPYTQTGEVTGFTNPVPDSIAGQSFHVNIQDGSDPFATNGDFVISFAGSGNTYTITSFSGGVNSQGTYSYSKLNSTCGGIALTDSVAGVSMAYLSLLNSTSGVFAITQSSTNYQIGALTLLTAQAPSSLVGKTIFSTVNSGTGPLAPPFGPHGYSFFVAADSGNGYQSIGITEDSYGTGTYSYSSSGPMGALNLVDSVQGPVSINVFVTSPLQGQYVESVGPYIQTADSILLTNPAPDSIAGQSFYVSVQDGADPFVTNGDFVLSFAGSGNTYTITSFSGGVNSQGTYSYSKLNSTCGGIALTDSVAGVSMAYLALSNSTSGAFAITQSPGSYQVGSVTLLTAQAPSSLVGKTIFSTVNSGTGPLAPPFGPHGYSFFVAADSGNGYQSIGITEDSYGTGTYSYSSSGPMGDLDLVDSVQGPVSINVFVTSPLQGQYVESVGPYIQTADSTLLTNPAPDSISGQGFYVSVQDGADPFATHGDFVLSFASSGNTYTIRAVGGSVANSQGTYSYSKLNSTCGGIALTDSVAGVSMAYLALSNSTSGAFAITQSPGSYQVGSVTVLPVLNLIQNGNQVMVSWTTNATEFSLQSSTSLSGPWSAAPSPTIVGGNYVSTDAISGNAMFYRLKK